MPRAPLTRRAGRAEADRVCINARLEEAPPDQTAGVSGIGDRADPAAAVLRPKWEARRARSRPQTLRSARLGALHTHSGGALPQMQHGCGWIGTLHNAADVRGQVGRGFLWLHNDIEAVCFGPPGCGLSPRRGALVVAACVD